MSILQNMFAVGRAYSYIPIDPEGQDCAAPTPPNDFTITSNVTDGGRVETCHFWRLNINGGESPYTVVLNAVNSPVITNITVQEGSDAVVYSNRADPGTTLFGKY